jgi:hypothetical protein
MDHDSNSSGHTIYTSYTSLILFTATINSATESTVIPMQLL